MRYKALSIIGVFIATLALGYLLIERPQNIQDTNIKSIDMSAVERSLVNGRNKNTSLGLEVHNAQKLETDLDVALTEGSIDNREQPEAIESIEKQFVSMSSGSGLNHKIAGEFLTSRDFDTLFSLVRQSDRDPEPYEVEFKYQDIFGNSEQIIKNNVYVGDLACDDRVCLTTVEYQDEESIDLFLEDVFFSEGRDAVGLMAQAVILDGVKQMRIIFDYTAAALIIDR